jgi:hypothetical protein
MAINSIQAIIRSRFNESKYRKYFAFASAATLSAGSVTLGDGGSGTLSTITGGYQMKRG